MSGLLASPMKYDSSRIEATVTKVDPDRYVCSVKTIKGQALNDVTWLQAYGSSSTPEFGDLVVIDLGLTYPVILGKLPKPGLASVTSSATGSNTGVDVGNSSVLRNGFSLDPNKPNDLVPGDKLTTTKTGGMFGLLSQGTFLAKASPLAQIILSKFGNVVRIVSQTLNLNADAGQLVLGNVKGRLYAFFGIDRLLSNTKYGTYEYTEFYGDVVAAEMGRGEPSQSMSPAATDGRVRVRKLNNSMIEVLESTGRLTTTINHGDTTIQTHDGSLWEVNCASHSFVTITPTSIVARVGSTTLTLTDTLMEGIVGGSKIHLDPSMSELIASGHRVGVSEAGVHIS